MNSRVNSEGLALEYPRVDVAEVSRVKSREEGMGVAHFPLKRWCEESQECPRVEREIAQLDKLQFHVTS